MRDQGRASNCRTVCGKRPKSARTSSSTTCMPAFARHLAAHAQLLMHLAALISKPLCVCSMIVQPSYCTPSDPVDAHPCRGDAAGWARAPRSRRRR